MKSGFPGTGALTSAIVTGLSSPGGGNYSILVSPRNASVAVAVPRPVPAVRILRRCGDRQGD
jgi:pyrroline-5-carboxylate reductase